MTSQQQGVARVLVVDDDPMVRLMVRELLPSNSFDVLEAPDGASALHILQQQSLDLVLLDIVLPDIDGFRCLERLSGFVDLDRLPVVMMTGQDSVEAIERAFALGAVDFITKPVCWAELPHRLGNVLRYQAVVKDLRRKKASLRASEDRYRLLCENLGNRYFFYTLDPEGHFIYLSESVTSMLGYTVEEFKCHYSTYLTDDPCNAMLPNHTRAALSGLAQPAFHASIFHKHGRPRILELSETPVFGHDGKVVSVTGIARDVTEELQALQRLHESEERLRLSLLAAKQGLYDLDVQGGGVVVNDQYALMLGYDPMAFHETLDDLFERMHPEDRAATLQAYREFIQGQSPSYRVEFRQLAADGSWKWVLSLGKVVEFGAGGAPLRVLGTHTDITERKEAEQRAQFLAFHDALTGLPNRALLQDRFRTAMSFADRTQTQVGVMVLDLDHFKQVNDSLGHLAGDRLLIAVAERIRGCVREVDTVSRYGGDEFVVLLHEIPGPEAVERVGRKMLREMAMPVAIGDEVVQASCSIGASFYPRDGSDMDALLRQADRALYQSKALGRNALSLAG